MKNMSKTEAIEKINEFFRGKHQREDVRKIKKLAMSHQIKLKEKKKLFCKKCFSMNLKVLGIKNKIKSMRCEDCGNLMRWKIKN
jgi:RNase P subunit RPR2